MDERKNALVVIGGGITGVTCVQTLSYLLSDWHNEFSIILIAGSPLVKAVTNFKQVSRTLEEFDIEESKPSWLNESYPNIKIIPSAVSHLDTTNQTVHTTSGEAIRYSKLCIATGGSPKLIASNKPNVVGIRDTETVTAFQEKLSGARRFIVVGNGGIATELVYETEACEVIWAVKHKTITHTFLDAGAAEFMLEHVQSKKSEESRPSKRQRYTVDKGKRSACPGTALGPDWHLGINVKGACSEITHEVHIEYECEVEEVHTFSEIHDTGAEKAVSRLHNESEKCKWPVYVKLTNGKVYGCDFVVCATGVQPNTKPFLKGNDFKLSEEGGIVVDENMQSNIPSIYAAGDVCTVDWPAKPHWFQMRLWSQARQMGTYAAKCVVAHMKSQEISTDFCFELFAHTTRFFGFKVVILGRYNAQGLGNDYDVLLRVTKGVEYVKVILQNGRMKGAILIGETDLEETFENLILNEMDLSMYGEHLLDPGIDIDDYFD